MILHEAPKRRAGRLTRNLALTAPEFPCDRVTRPQLQGRRKARSGEIREERKGGGGGEGTYMTLILDPLISLLAR